MPFAFHVRFQCRLSHVWNVDHSIAAFAQGLFPVSFKCSQPTFVLWIKFPLPIVNAISSLTFWTHLRHKKTGPETNKFYTSQLLRATFTSWFHLLRGGLNNAPGIPQRRRGYLDTLNKKHGVVLLWKAWPFFETMSFSTDFRCWRNLFNLFMSKWTYFTVSSSIQGLFHKIQALLLQIQGENHFQGVFKDLAVFQGVFQARANHEIQHSLLSLPPWKWTKILLKWLNC